jgi:hypothetical protein
MRGTRLLGAALATVVAVAAAGPARANDEDVGSRHWNMACGGPDRTSRVTCEPIRRTPKEIWKTQLAGGLLCDPVVWDGTAFVLTRDDKGRNVLLALDVRTGDEKARKILLQSTADIVSLAVWQGAVVMTEPEVLQGFLFKGDGFQPLWKKKGDFWRDPGICRDLLLVYDGSNYVVHELRRGRKIDISIYGGGLACVSFPDPKEAIVATVQKDADGDDDLWLRPRYFELSDLGKRTPSKGWGPGDDRAVVMFDSSEEVSI